MFTKNCSGEMCRITPSPLPLLKLLLEFAAQPVEYGYRLHASRVERLGEPLRMVMNLPHDVLGHLRGVPDQVDVEMNELLDLLLYRKVGSKHSEHSGKKAAGGFAEDGGGEAFLRSEVIMQVPGSRLLLAISCILAPAVPLRTKTMRAHQGCATR